MTQKKAIPSSLNKHIPKGDADTYSEYYYCEACREIRKLFRKVVEDKIEMAIVSSEKKNKYELPSWSEYQADELGYRRAMREMIALLDK